MTSDSKLFPTVLSLTTTGRFAIQYLPHCCSPWRAIVQHGADASRSRRYIQNTDPSHPFQKQQIKISEREAVNLCLTKSLRGDADADSSVQDRERASVSHCPGAFHSSSPAWCLTSFAFAKEHTEVKREPQEVCRQISEVQLCPTEQGEDALVGDFLWASSYARWADRIEVAALKVLAHSWREEEKHWRLRP